MEEIEWLGTRAAASYLGVTPRTLYRLIDEGLPAYRLGRVIRVKEADLVAHLERARIPPGSLRHLYPEPLRPAQDGLTGSP
jgi:excisionase family DNA binding protein